MQCTRHNSDCTLCSSLLSACQLRNPPSIAGCFPATFASASAGTAIISQGSSGLQYVHCFDDPRHLLIEDEIILSKFDAHSFGSRDRRVDLGDPRHVESVRGKHLVLFCVCLCRGQGDHTLLTSACCGLCVRLFVCLSVCLFGRSLG